jgi:hypothetical protein
MDEDRVAHHAHVSIVEHDSAVTVCGVEVRTRCDAPVWGALPKQERKAQAG